MTWTIHQGDCLEVLKTLPAESVHCCVTSPPYWGLRDYGVAGQLGLEKAPEEYVDKMVEVFREVRRVLRNDGTLWLNLGDSYAAGGQNAGSTPDNLTDKQRSNGGCRYEARKAPAGMKPKDLCGIPWMVAFALRDDGWYLRNDIIWHKPNPMPESVTDRCTKSHEHIFLLAKSSAYYYNADAICDELAPTSIARLSQPRLSDQQGSDRVPGKTNGPMRGVFGGRNKHTGYGVRIASGREDDGKYLERGVNKRDVWTVATACCKDAHFATFPPKLIEPCILAGAPPNGVVLDPFNGAGTTGLVATRLGRSYIGIELNPKYVEMAKRRIIGDAPLFNSADAQ